MSRWVEVRPHPLIPWIGAPLPRAYRPPSPPPRALEDKVQMSDSMKPKIGMVTLGVADVARSVAFYRDGLGFSTHNYAVGDPMVMFKLEGSWLGLFPRNELAADATVPADGSGFSGVVLAHLEGSPEAVDRVFQIAVRAGARSIKTPRKVSWGGYSGYFGDPDGHLWEVAYNPFTDLT